MTFNAIKTGLITAAVTVATLGGASLAFAAGGGDYAGDYKMEHKHWHFNGLRGTYDRAAMQRGYQIYREVCSSCHALEHLDFRHLGDKGAPFYMKDFPNPNDNPLVKAFAADWEVNDIDSETGDSITRPGIPADSFPAIYPNAAAARASNGGALPPDLSVITKARNNGPDYVYNLLIAYGSKMPESMEGKIGQGQYYNPVMEGGAIAMAPQLTDGQITYEGENAPEATVEQMAADVTEFLAWSGDPKLEQRKRAGFGTLIYLFLLSILLWLSYKKVWKNVKH